PLRRPLAPHRARRLPLRAAARAPAIVEVAQRLLRTVRDVARDLLVTELRRPRVDLVLLDVDRGQLVVLDQPLRDDDRVLEVVALPGHERDGAVLAQRDLSAGGRGAVGEDVALLDLVADLDDRALAAHRA